jgi:hypothetical protein
MVGGLGVYVVFGFLTDQELHGRPDLVPHSLLAALIVGLAAVAAVRTGTPPYARQAMLSIGENLTSATGIAGHCLRAVTKLRQLIDSIDAGFQRRGDEHAGSDRTH